MKDEREPSWQIDKHTLVIVELLSRLKKYYATVGKMKKNSFWIRKSIHRQAPKVHFFPSIGRLQTWGKIKCSSRALVWVNFDNSTEWIFNTFAINILLAGCQSWWFTFLTRTGNGNIYVLLASEIAWTPHPELKKPCSSLCLILLLK